MTLGGDSETALALRTGKRSAPTASHWHIQAHVLMRAVCGNRRRRQGCHTHTKTWRAAAAAAPPPGNALRSSPPPRRKKLYVSLLPNLPPWSARQPRGGQWTVALGDFRLCQLADTQPRRDPGATGELSHESGTCDAMSRSCPGQVGDGTPSASQGARIFAKLGKAADHTNRQDACRDMAQCSRLGCGFVDSAVVVGKRFGVCGGVCNAAPCTTSCPGPASRSDPSWSACSHIPCRNSGGTPAQSGRGEAWGIPLASNNKLHSSSMLDGVRKSHPSAP